MKTIIKRNGDSVPFQKNKIRSAVRKAFQASKESCDIERDSELISTSVVERLISEGRNTATVEQVQNYVEEALMKHQFFDTARRYILYRAERAQIRQKVSGDKVSLLVKESAAYFNRDTMREFVYYRTYSRWIETLKRREVWIETVDRYMNYMKKQLSNKLTPSEYEEVRQAILNQEVMPSMRLLQFSGPAVDRCNVCAYNCAYTAPRSLEDLAEIMYISMRGTGVGWSVESKNVECLPMVSPQKNPPVLRHHVVADSAEGWCDAFLFALKSWFAGEDCSLDYSKVRPAGAKLYTMGGRSSGPRVLQELMEFSRSLILSRQGQKLRPIDVHDLICKIGEVVVSGGVRRCLAKGSRVLVKDPDTLSKPREKPVEEVSPGDQVLTFSGWKRVVRRWESGFQFVLRIEHSHGVLDCTPNHRMAVLFGSGFLWKEAGTLTTEDVLVYPEEREKEYVLSPIPISRILPLPEPVETYDLEVEENHCFVCEGVLVHNSAMISLSDYHDNDLRDAKKGAFWNTHPHRAMANNSAVYNSKPSAIEFMEEWLALAKSGTGERGIFNRQAILATLPERRKKTLSGYTEFGGNPCVTADTWVHTVTGPQQVSDLIGVPTLLLVNGQPVLTKSSGFFFTGYKEVFTLRLKRGFSVRLTENHPVCVKNIFGNQEWRQVKDLSPGDLVVLSNHRKCVQWNGIGTFEESYRMGDIFFDNIFRVDPERTSSEFYRGLLSRLFEETLQLSRPANQLFIIQRMLARLGVISTVTGDCLTVTGDNAKVLLDFLGEDTSELKDLSPEPFVDEVLSIEPSGREDVYDVTVDQVFEFCGNGIRLHNCNEVVLQSKQFCNLSEVVCRPHDNLDSLIRKVRIATLLGTYQSTLTKFNYISPEWAQHQEQERLLGVSLTGQWDCPVVRKRKTLSILKQVALSTNEEYAKRFGINVSTAITLVKPSGTVSQMTDASSGVHPRFAPYYIRRIRISATDPLLRLMRDQGYPCYPEVGQNEENATTFVLEFPQKAPDNAICVKDVTALDQLKYWKKVKKYYVEHNPSVTIYVKPHEWLEVGNWIWKNWNYASGLSFLPYSEHVYQMAPYEEISSERYEQMVNSLPRIDFSKLIYYEYEDRTDVKRELACTGDKCEL